MLNKIIEYKIITSNGIRNGRIEFLDFNCEGNIFKKEIDRRKRIEHNTKLYNKAMKKLINAKNIFNIEERSEESDHYHNS